MSDNNNTDQTAPELLISLAGPGNSMYAPALFAVTDTEVIIASPDGREHRGFARDEMKQLWERLTTPTNDTPVEYTEIEGVSYLKGQARSESTGQVIKIQIPTPWTNKVNRETYHSLTLFNEMLTVPPVEPPPAPLFEIFQETAKVAPSPKVYNTDDEDEWDDDDDSDFWNEE